MHHWCNGISALGAQTLLQKLVGCVFSQFVLKQAGHGTIDSLNTKRKLQHKLKRNVTQISWAIADAGVANSTHYIGIHNWVTFRLSLRCNLRLVLKLISRPVVPFLELRGQRSDCRCRKLRWRWRRTTRSQWWCAEPGLSAATLNLQQKEWGKHGIREQKFR